MNVLAITGMAVIAAAMSVVLKPKNPEYSLMLSLITGVLIIGSILTTAAPLFTRIGSLLESTGAGSTHVQILFKSLGICFVTQIACDACRDMGESAIASKVETAGKISVLLISLPLFEQILGIAVRLIGT